MTNRQELIDKLSKKYPDLSKDDLHDIVVKFFDYISDQLESGNRAEIRGFGSLEIGARKVTSPFAKNKSHPKIRKTIKYKASKTLLDALN